MNAIKSKVLFAGLSMFAFTAIHAQDTSKTPQPDTTKPKKDTTVMINLNKVGNENTVMLDTTKPKKDTTVMINLTKVSNENTAMLDTTKPKKDTTVMINLTKVSNEKAAIVNASFVMINDNKAAAKMEAIESKKMI